MTVSWSKIANAAQYVIERSSNRGAFVVIATVAGNVTSVNDAATAATVYFYRVHAIDAGRNAGATSMPAVATTIVFNADPSGIIRASHFTDLRSAIDVFRASAGLGAFQYTHTVAPGRPVRAIDVTEMRTAVQQARSTYGLPSYAFTDSPISIGVTTIKAAHLRELQQAIGAAAWP